MNIKQQSKTRMFLSTQAVLAANADLVNTIPAAEEAATELDTVIERILAIAKERESRSGTGVKQADHAASTRQLPALFASGDSILNDRLDKLVVQFKAADEDFYNKYQSARSIVDRAGTRNNGEETDVSSNNSTVSSVTPPLPKAA